MLWFARAELKLIILNYILGFIRALCCVACTMSGRMPSERNDFSFFRGWFAYDLPWCQFTMLNSVKNS